MRWSSSNPAAASIEANGKITANAVGTATITATTVDGGHKLNCVVTVRPPDSAPKVEKRIKLNINEMTLGLNRNNPTYANYHPLRPVLFKDGQGENIAADGIYWSSSNTTTVGVNNVNTSLIASGVITSGNFTGVVRIMATAIDGGYTDVCEVTVGNVGTQVSGLAVNNAGGTNIMNIMKYLTLSMRFNPPTGEVNTGMFTPIITPTNATNKEIKWFNSNPEVARINEATGEITAQAVGRTIVTATTVSNGYSGTVEVVVVPGGNGSVAPDIVPVSGISIEIDDNDPIKIVNGILTIWDTAKIKVVVHPENASNKEYVWIGNSRAYQDYGYFTIDDTGVIQPRRRMYVGLEVMSLDGGKTGSCLVNLTYGFRSVPHTNSFDGKGFYMGIYEFTEEMAVNMTGAAYTKSVETPYEESGPIPSTGNYYNALQICNQMSIREGLTPAYEMPDNTNAWNAATWTNYTTDTARWGNPPASYTNSATQNVTRWRQVRIKEGSTGYRLPTPEQWEFAYRGGASVTYNWYWSPNGAWDYSDSYSTIAGNNYAWWYGNSYKGNANNQGGTYRPHTVGQKVANNYGLYDMAGNVWEWCYVPLLTDNARGHIRGGGYYSAQGLCAVTAIPLNGNQPYPYDASTSYGGNGVAERLGFRVIRPPLPTEQ
jgi:uncharacterized protein YjdB/formylglycine-generating enzyme required for sulfatase activity